MDIFPKKVIRKFGPRKLFSSTQTPRQVSTHEVTKTFMKCLRIHNIIITHLILIAMMTVYYSIVIRPIAIKIGIAIKIKSKKLEIW